MNQLPVTLPSQEPPATETERRRLDSFSPDPADRPAAPERAAPLLGLCVNCDHRQDCQIARAPAGVWHCEEYR